jgi:hypothetical protein
VTNLGNKTQMVEAEYNIWETEAPHAAETTTRSLSPLRSLTQTANSGTKRRHKGALPLVGESELSPVILV